ncbi:MAG: leucine-rich repeat protein, partial [Bacteroidales bacterium]|nr:leucine-rich repeat protein [Bacteroidales bacterium]
MKHLLLSICALAAIFLTLPCQAQTYDFSAVAPSGQTLYYKIGTTGEVSVVHPNSNPSSSNAYISGVLTIPDSVFYNNIWYSVTSIGDYAFDYCTSLTSITIPNSVTSIGNYAFWGCSSLTSITIPNSVTSIGDYAFSHCSSLTSITIPNSVTSIGNYAFYICSSLTSITIPNSVDSIGSHAFRGCSALISMNVSPGNPTFDSRDSCNAIIKTTSNTLIAGCKNTIIPNSVTSIGDYAFDYCSSLTSITIPNTVTSIGDYAFNYCTSLTSITIPNSVDSISSFAFSHCSSLTSITIPNSVTSIGNHAFYHCSSLTSITIPNSVTSIGDYAFDYCSSLTSITIPNSVTSIGNYAFWGCTSLTSITIPNSVTSIGSNAFRDCSLDTVNVFWNYPILLGNNYQLTSANVINIPCGTTANYQNGWGAGNYHEQAAAVLTLSVSDNNGTVTIVSQNTQQSSFCIGSTALIQAIPNYGYHFTQWNDGNTDNPRTVTITQDTTFTAFFAKNQYTLSVASNDNAMGSVTGGGTYEYLDTVTLIATATTHYHFVRWSDWNTDTSRTIIITDNLSLIAIFAIDYHNVVSYVNNTSYGHVEGAGHYPYGSTAMVTAIAHNGHYFREWDNGTATPSISFTITGDTSFTALFAPEIIPTICMVTVEND